MKMKDLYAAVGTSKQAFHKRLDAELLLREEQAQVLPLVRELRRDHPMMSVRTMYPMLGLVHMGRDAFIRFCNRNGLRVQRKRRFFHTTDSRGVQRFPNLLAHIERIDGPNQVWVSDITYLEILGRFYYITLIMDLFSRAIVGFGASDGLSTEKTTLPALRMALANRGIAKGSGLVFHSDGGGQYYSEKFLKLTQCYGILNSMSEDVFGNSNAERVNGTIKNDYLGHYQLQNLRMLITLLIKVVYRYNYQRPHKSLGNQAPMEFERLVSEKLLTKTWTIVKRKKVAKKEKLLITLI
jgi:transposase InsO family protein